MSGPPTFSHGGQFGGASAAHQDVPGEGQPAARRDVGFIADELEAAGLEELLGRDDDGALVGLRYSRVVALLLEIVRDQDERIDALEAASGRAP